MFPIRRLRLALSAFAVVAALSPFTFAAGSGVTVNTAACADGTCCAEEMSLCFINGIRTENAYLKSGPGSCKPGDA